MNQVIHASCVRCQREKNGKRWMVQCCTAEQVLSSGLFDFWDIFRRLPFFLTQTTKCYFTWVCWIPQNHFSTCASLITITLLRIAKLLWVPGHPPSPNVMSRAIHIELSPFPVGGLYSYLPFFGSVFRWVDLYCLINMVSASAELTYSFFSV